MSSPSPTKTIFTIDEVCSTFCPIFYLHPNEDTYRPYSLPDIMRCSKFEYDGVLANPPLITSIPPDAVSQFITPSPKYIIENSVLSMADTTEKLLLLLEKFTGISEAYSPERRLLIIDPKKPRQTTPEVQAIFSDPFTYMKKTYFTITYLLFYAYNGTLESHNFDQEYATFLFTCKSYQFQDNTTLEVYIPSLERIYLSSHGKGKWFNRDEFELSGDRPYIYIAFESHSMYNEPLVFRRFFGFGNDETAKGEIYDPINSVIVLAHPTSVLIKHYYLLNKLYYFNGRYEDQFSNLFSQRRTNLLQYDGYYKVASTAELWEIKPFKDYRGYFVIIFWVSLGFMLVILLDTNDFCVMVSYICLVVFTIICIFLLQWLYLS